MSEPQKINIRHCPSCDGSHDGVVLNEYVKDQGTWTHWYSCLVTEDPVPMCLRFKESGVVEPERAIVDGIVKAEETSHYMVCVFSMSGGRVDMLRTTHDFPTNEFNTALKLMHDDIQREIGPPEQKPLEEVENVGPSLDVFGQASPVRIVDGRVEE